MSIRKAAVEAVVEVAPSCMVTELGSSSSQDAAVASINGRYPETGFALNRESSMVIRVIRGMGDIATKDSTENLRAGDVVFIDADTPYRYEGHFEVMIVSTPPWSAGQYEYIED